MTTLAVDTPRAYELGTVNEIPMVAADIIYEGAAVGLSSGYARPLVAGDTFVGFAERRADNASGLAGAINVRVVDKGLLQLAVTGVTAVTDVGAPVYASDDNTFTLTASTNTLIGVVHRFVSTGVAVVMFDTPRPPASITGSDLGADCVTGAKIADDAVSLEHLDAGITPSHIVVYAGTISWSGSGASLATTVTGVAATDIVTCTIQTAPTQAAYIKSAVPTTNTITVTLSAANTSNDAVIYYTVARAAA